MTSNVHTEETLNPNEVKCQEDDINNILQYAFELIEEGIKELKLCDEHENVVLILGSTGTGKSTFTQWIAGDESKLVGKKISAGEYLIKGDDRIGESTINSETIFPELIMEQTSDVAFYDCPGFGDTRSLSYDLATTYLIKTVAEQAKNLKLVFTINHTSVREGENRTDLMSLLKHITCLLKDIDSFRESICVVVTKVGNLYETAEDDTLQLISDRTIINNIGQFLKHAKEDLRKNIENPTCTENSFYAAAIKIIDILLSKNGDMYTKIGIFRRPRKEELLSESTLLKNEKITIKRMIFDRLQYTESKKNCFGYGLSEKSMNDIHDVVRDINEKLWSQFSSISVQVRDYFHHLLEDIYKKLESFATLLDNTEGDVKEAESHLLKFREGSTMVGNLVKNLDNLKDAETIIQTISDRISELNSNISEDDMMQMKNQAKYLKFLQTLGEKDLDTMQWSSIFKEISAYIYDAEKEIQNLIDIAAECTSDQLKEILCNLTRSIQEKYIRRMKSLDIKKLLSEISKDKFFLLDKREKIKTLSTTKELIDIFFDVKNNLGIYLPIRFLNDLTVIENRFLFLEKFSTKQIGSTAVLPFLIALEDFITLLQKYETWYKFLLDLYSKFSEYRVQKEKFLYNVRDIDDWGMLDKPAGIDINAENLRQFLEKITSFSVAESNDIKNDSKIEINFEELNHVLDLTLRKEINVSCREKSTIVKGDYISLKNVFKGLENNTYAVRNAENETFQMMLELGKIKSINFFASKCIFIDEDLVLKGKGISVSFFTPKFEVVGSRKIDLSYDYEQNLCGKAGGTFFGFCVEPINMENLTIFIDSSNASRQNKQEGQRETGMINQSRTDLPLAILEISLSPPTSPSSGTDKQLGHILSHLPFDNRKNCFKKEQIADSSQSCDDFIMALNEFKCYLRENLCDRFKQSSILNYFHCLDCNTNIINAYSAKDFADELFGLDRQYNELHDKINFIPFYQSLGKRINDIIPHMKHDDVSCQCTHFLGLVHTAVLTIIHNLQNKSEFYLTVDINEHMKFVREYMEIFKKSQKIKNKSEILRKCANNYKSGIDLKIEEAQYKINTEIFSEIDDVKNIDIKIEELMEEVLTLQVQSEAEKRNLLKIKEEIQDSIRLRMAIAFYKIFGNVIRSLWSLGIMFGNIIKDSESGATRMQDHQTDTERSQSLPRCLTTVSSSMQSLDETIDSIRTRKVKNLQDLFEEICLEISKKPKTLKKVFSKIYEIKRKFDCLVGKSTDFKEIQTIETELNQELSNQEKELKVQTSAENEAGDNENVIALTLVKKFKIATKLLAVGYDLYKMYRNDKAKLVLIDNAIDQIENKVQLLRLYNEKIYLEISPMLEKMKVDLLNTVRTMEESSRVNLDITKWQVQSKMKEVKIFIKNLTQGLKAHGELELFIERQEEAIITLIRVYDRIQHFQEQKSIINYIADVASVEANDANISDPNLIGVYNWLKVIIDRNILLMHYKMLLNVFKQWSFPFAHICDKQMQLPQHFKMENVEDVVFEAMEKIGREIKHDNMSIRKQDKYICTAEFQSRNVFTQPFFIWTKKYHGDMISKLLSGEKVTAKADVRESPLDKDAIKFDYIDLNFAIDDENMQYAINEDMKKYKVRATHLGNSYYRCGDKYYGIPSASQTIEWSIEKSNNGEPVDKNKVHDKLKSGDLMLSPYTMWEFELIHRNKNTLFTDLERYKGKVDLELIGHGSYISKQTDLSQLQLEKFYCEFLVQLN